MQILSIDPAPELSAYCIIDTDDYFCLECGKVPNGSLERIIRTRLTFDRAIIEGVSSYGARVGDSVFETCYEVGRLCEIIESTARLGEALGEWEFHEAEIIKRREVKRLLHLPSNTNDAGVIQYLTHRFADGEPNFGKGTKAHPSWFFGFKADIWQAYALGVAYIDREGFEHRARDRFKGE